MSKETTLASKCPGCGQHIYYVEQHIPNCPDYPAHVAKAVRQATKMELAPKMDTLTHTVGEVNRVAVASR